MLAERGLDLAAAQSVLDKPEQSIRLSPERVALQSRMRDAAGQLYLLRLVVDDAADPPVVTTIYRTTKLAKYWRTN